jgi:hypothetical protein
LACDRKSTIGIPDKVSEQAQASGWIIEGMKQDWEGI